MARIPVRKWLFYVAAAHLALATMGTLALMPLDFPYFEASADRNPAKRALLNFVAYPVECLAVSPEKDHSFSPLRQCLPRMAMPVNFLAAGAGPLQAAVRRIIKTQAYTAKPLILLNLRI